MMTKEHPNVEQWSKSGLLAFSMIHDGKSGTETQISDLWADFSSSQNHLEKRHCDVTIKQYKTSPKWGKNLIDEPRLNKGGVIRLWGLQGPQELLSES
jgi:hypothetical protein